MQYSDFSKSLITDYFAIVGKINVFRINSRNSNKFKGSKESQINITSQAYSEVIG